MEHLDPKYFACTKPINIKQYFSKFSEDIKTVRESIDKTKFTDDIKDSCSINKLNHRGEIIQSDNKTTLWKTVSLESSATSGHLRIQRIKNKWDCYEEPKHVLSFPAERDQKNEDKEDLIPHQDTLLIVRLYRPFQPQLSVKCEVKYTHEYAILGKQSLSDLRDVFKCVHDFGVSVELEHPDDKITSDTKEEYPSGFIFIENCFYNDTRHPNAIEYSREVIEWANKKNLSGFTTAKMENTIINNLKIRIGYPYLYQHQGNCEHLVVFTDIRLLRPDENLTSSKYPYVLSYNKFNRMSCAMCSNKLAQYNVTECDRLHAKCNYLCKSCVLAYNYRDGKKVGSFKLFPFYDINMTSLY